VQKKQRGIKISEGLNLRCSLINGKLKRRG
jgi:hypothetical protein